MVKITSTTSLLLLLPCAVHSLEQVLQQPHIQPPKHSKFRDLIWGDLNFIHTTDTHGWLSGHLNQKQYSGDWGDFISFTERLHQKADKDGVDLLLIDTGDKHDGNGLSDGTSPNGLLSTPIFNEQDYDLVTIGNHELYQEDYSTQEYEVSVPKFSESYVSSNVEYKLDNDTWVPFGQKYRYFQTKNKGYKILALSFLFDFKRYNSKTRVFPIKDTLKQSWFQNVTNTYTEEDIDILIIFGHIPVTDFEEEEIIHLHVSLRKIYPNLVIHYFGGHSHIRDYSVYDYKAVGLQSGRYCETIGFASVNISDYDQPIFNRRYIDFNREGLIHHSDVESKDKFDTEKGLEITKRIKETRKTLNLTYSYGYVPQNYPLNEYPYGHSSNLYTFLNSSILPNLHNTINRDESHHDRMIIVNSGSIRYDLFKGNFTKDSEFTISPFQNEWEFIIVNKNLAMKLESYLNQQEFFLGSIELASPLKRAIYNKETKRNQMNSLNNGIEMESSSCPYVKKPGLKKGQTTHDEMGCDGDDVLHNSVPFYSSPNVVVSYQIMNQNKNKSKTKTEHESESEGDIDVVFYSFIKPYVLSALNELNHRYEFVDGEYDSHNVMHYGGESTGTLLREYIQREWS